MEKNKNRQLETYIHENVKIENSEQVHEHMDSIGFSKHTWETDENLEQWYSPNDIDASAFHDILDESSDLPLHSHTFMEIVYYQDADGIEYFINGHRYAIRPGDIVCLPPRQLHKVIRHTNRPCHRTLLIISEEVLENLGWNLNTDQFYLFRSSAQNRINMFHTMENMVQEYSTKKSHYKYFIQGYASLLLGLILRDENTDFEPEQDTLFEKVVNYIQEHISEVITLQRISKEFYVSERTINREFKKYLDTTFHQYLTNHRLNYAKTLIRQGVPLLEVSERCGFSDYPTFYRAFKKAFSISPKDTR